MGPPKCQRMGRSACGAAHAAHAVQQGHVHASCTCAWQRPATSADRMWPLAPPAPPGLCAAVHRGAAVVRLGMRAAAACVSTSWDLKCVSTAAPHGATWTAALAHGALPSADPVNRSFVLVKGKGGQLPVAGVHCRLPPSAQLSCRGGRRGDPQRAMAGRQAPLQRRDHFVATFRQLLHSSIAVLEIPRAPAAPRRSDRFRASPRHLRTSCPISTHRR